MPFVCEEFQVFNFGVIVKLFSFLSCSSSFFFFFSLHFLKTFIKHIKVTYGVKASEHE